MTTYSIQIDDLDLALLPLRTHTYNFPQTHNFIKKEYFEFLLIKEEISEDTTSEQSMATYTCHICAVDVPAAFASEHAASAKHRATARIASEAARRTRALISSVPPPPAPKPSGRFCANCSTTVGKDHDKSKEHRVAVMHDKLLWQLASAYVGDDPEHVDDEKIDSREKTNIDDRKDDNKMKKIYGNKNSNAGNNLIDVHTVEKHCVQDENGQINDKKLEGLKYTETNEAETSRNTTKSENNPNENVTHSTSRLIELPIKEVIEDKTTETGPAIGADQLKAKNNKQEYGEQLRKLMDPNNPFEIKEFYNRIQLKTKDITVNVHSDHFHSYQRNFYSGKIQCILCDCTFNVKDQEVHKYDFNHMAGVVKLGSDDGFIRKINESYSHCIICNQKIKNVNLSTHGQSQYHITRKTYNTKPNTIKSKLLAKTDKKENDTKNSNGAVNDTIANNSIALEAKTNNVINSQIEYPYENIPGKYDVRCVICDCDVPRNIHNRVDHAKGLRHVNNLK